MFERYIVLDFESYYDKEFSLRKMTPPQYVLDTRFRSFGAAVTLGDSGKTQWLDHDKLVLFVERIKRLPYKVAIVSHNALFDMCVLNWHYGYVPPLMIDTMGMARALLGHVLKFMSLESVANYLGIGQKGKFLANVSGMQIEDIIARGWYDSYTDYAKLDADLTRGIFQALRKLFPIGEYLVMHSVIECAVKPRFIIDKQVLAEHKHFLALDKDDLLTRAGLTDRTSLMSNDKFAEALRSLGVEPDMKKSLKTGNDAYAFAKSDQFMVDLEEHDDPLVQALVAARVGHKSTLEETRTQRFISISELDCNRAYPGTFPDGAFPFPLRYGAAHTHRLGGDWKLNGQNMPRKYVRNGVEKSGRLRTSLAAPPGYKVVTADSAQIEARVNAVVSNEIALIEGFRRKEDIYSQFAGEEIYHYPVNKKNNPNERFVGKQSILGLGFQMGAPKFQTTVRVQSRLQLGQEMEITLGDASLVVQAYRRRFANIAKSWNILQNLLPDLSKHDSGIMFGPMRFGKQEITGPNGLKLYYHNLEQRYIDGKWSWTFTYGGKPKYLYGGKLLENIVQFLARIHIMHVGEMVRKRTGIGYAAQVHDELIYVVPEYLVEYLSAILAEEIVRSPWWAPNLPLDYDLGVGNNYGEAK